MPKPLLTRHSTPPSREDAKPLSIFVPITKVDAAKRLVYGVFSAEAIDKSGEVFDYATGKGAFQAWSDEIYAASGGKSRGNVREMHDKRAVGRVEDIKFDDENKRVLGVVKVIDDDAWNKVQEGVLNGFSIGGGYAKRWQGSDGNTHYTPTLSEVSLVDNPCLPEATFEFVKVDGTTEVRKFHSLTDQSSNQEADMAKNDKKTNVTPTSTQGWQALDGSFYLNKADADAASAEHLAKAASAPMQAIIEKALTAGGLPNLPDAGDGTSLEGTSRTDTAQNTPGVLTGGQNSSKGGSTAQSDNAGYAKGNNADDVKKDDGVKKDDDMEMVASENDANKAVDESTQSLEGSSPGTAVQSNNATYAEKAARLERLRKSLHDAGRMAHLLQDLAWLQSGLAAEAKWEGDNSPIPGQIESIMRVLGETLKALTAEEVGELFQDSESEVTEVVIMELADQGGALKKFLGEQGDFPVMKALHAGLEKAGKRHSATDSERVQKIHDMMHDMHKVAGKMVDHSINMAKCIGLTKNTSIDLGADGSKLPAFDDKADASRTSISNKSDAGGELQKAVFERDSLSKAFEQLTPKVEKMASTIEALSKANAELTDRLKKIEDQPLPAKGTLRTISKSADGVEADAAKAPMEKQAVETALANMTPEQRSLLLVKAAKMNPMRN